MSTDELAEHNDVLRARYRAERDKRLLERGGEQWVPMRDFAEHLVDPFTMVTDREPLRDEVEVAFVGAGVAALIVGARLRMAGVTDIRLIDKAGDVGGTWYWNRYPGAQCDIESYIYLPLLEETGYMPTEKYAHTLEIQDHCRRIADQFGLYENACFGTEVTSLKWEQSTARWVIATNRGDQMRARFVVMAIGFLHLPKLPGIPGIEDFEEHWFHTSRWDYAYTGGGPSEPMVKLADKRVAIVGTGATAVQCVPHLARACKELLVFQRTPSTVRERGNGPTDADWAARLERGWQRARMENFTALTSGGSAPTNLVGDGWTELFDLVAKKVVESGDFSREAMRAASEAADFELMDSVRARVDSQVSDPATAEALKPWYNLFCKRPCFHDEYLQAFNLPGVRLIDTDGRGVDCFTAKAVVVDGVHYEVDCVIFGTGFDVNGRYWDRAGFDPVGRDGLQLSKHWSEGIRSLHGIHVHGFPNAFVVHSLQRTLSPNYSHLVEDIADEIVHVITTVQERGATSVEATADAEAAWVGAILDKRKPKTSARGFGGNNDCTPSYYNNEGQRDPANALGVPYPMASAKLFKLLVDWRDDGTLQGLELR